MGRACQSTRDANHAIMTGEKMLGNDREVWLPAG